jgi:hypothetical protein
VVRVTASVHAQGVMVESVAVVEEKEKGESKLGCEQGETGWKWLSASV